MSDPTDNQDGYGNFSGYNLLLSSLKNLDERGSVLTLAAFAEESLGALLKSFMLPSSATEKLLEGFNAPLGTFSSRIQLSAALGLVTEAQFRDLEHLRKIRNEYAHTWKPVSLCDKKLVDHVGAISYCPFDEYPETPFEKVRSSLSWLLMEIQVTAAQMHKRRNNAKPIGRHLVPGLSGDFDQQLQEARQALSKLEVDIAQSTGSKLAFLLLVRKSWADRLYYVEASAPVARRSEVTSLRGRLLLRLAEASGDAPRLPESGGSIQTDALSSVRSRKKP